MSSFSQTPDAPQAFSFKTSWFAVKDADARAVVEALALGDATVANWQTGLAASYAPSGAPAWLFVSPQVGGWVFAVSSALPCPSAVETRAEIGAAFERLLSRLMRRFAEVQFFGSHRVVGYVAWARASNGEATRIFSYADGEVLMNLGVQTPEEAKLGLADLSGLTPEEAVEEMFRGVEWAEAEVAELIASGLTRTAARERVEQKPGCKFPDEEDVLALAALWSLDPSRFEADGNPEGLGLALRLPKEATG